MWYYEGRKIQSLKDVPQGAIGFVYEIVTEGSNPNYIGRKSFFSVQNKQVSKAVYDKAKAEGKEVSKTKDKKKSRRGKPYWRYKVKQITETNWKTYTGSSVDLNKEIKNGLKIKRRILQFCYNKKQLTYYEMKHQVCSGVIEENNDGYYNLNVLGKYFPADLKNNE